MISAGRIKKKMFERDLDQRRPKLSAAGKTLLSTIVYLHLLLLTYVSRIISNVYLVKLRKGYLRIRFQ